MRTAVRIGELYLALRIVAPTSLFPHVYYRWWPVVVGASRHSWQQQGSINEIIKGCRIKRRSEEDVKVWV
ncbi:hypothetical protein DEO72_LG4g387 [Vigna unguiculata]|uniref:Uncharacterized protein n=1 Tax=Vigna unguiculata TaxID=3917 RepID=A0A4D6LLR3_VIGUN|nr:hypothetical protein DEO72_LG4g387 [Vigna unguiculata]